jgi:hypothetical protein
MSFHAIRTGESLVLSLRAAQLALLLSCPFDALTHGVNRHPDLRVWKILGREMAVLCDSPDQLQLVVG